MVGGFFSLSNMEQYFKKRIKELEDLEIEAINSGNVVEATKLSFAKCELIDAKIFICDQSMKEIREELNAIS